MIPETVQYDAQIRLVPTCGRRPCELLPLAYLNHDPGLCSCTSTYLFNYCPLGLSPLSSQDYPSSPAQQLYQEAFEMSTDIALGSYDYVRISCFTLPGILGTFTNFERLRSSVAVEQQVLPSRYA